MSQATRIPASVATCRWGGFDASFAPVASIASGETIILECVSGGPEVMPGPEKGLPLHFRNPHQAATARRTYHHRPC